MADEGVKVEGNPFATPTFGGREHPAAPDYGDLANWIAHPDKGASCLPNNLAPDGDTPMPLEDRRVVCFFVGGTCYFGNLAFGEGAEAPADPWNSPVPHPQANEWCDLDIASQASCLNNRCQIFSPRYRQSSVPSHNGLLRAGASEADRTIAIGTMELANYDVQRAFDHFLSLPQTKDKPIIIASHSQGTMHTQRLMERFEKDPVLRSRLICAYLFGPLGSMPSEKFEKAFPSLHPCNGPLDSACIASFDCVGEKFMARKEDKTELEMLRGIAKDPPTTLTYAIGSWESPKGKKQSCTNPLTWTREPGVADASLHLGRCEKVAETKDITACEMGGGAGFWPPAREAVGLKLLGIRKVNVGELSAEISREAGVIVKGHVDGCEDEHEEWEDFYFNVRENVARRVDAYLEATARAK